MPACPGNSLLIFVAFVLVCSSQCLPDILHQVQGDVSVPNISADNTAATKSHRVEDWSVADVVEYIRLLPHEEGLSAEAFAEQDIDGKTLVALTQDGGALLATFAAPLRLRTVRSQVSLINHIRAALKAPDPALQPGSDAPADCAPSEAEAPIGRSLLQQTASPASAASLDDLISLFHPTDFKEPGCMIHGECGTDVHNALWGHVTEQVNTFVFPYSVHGPAQVKLQVSLQKIFELDAPRGVLRLAVWVRVSWRDPRISWDPSKWNGIDELIMPSDAVWIPELEIYNLEEGLAEGLVDKPMSVSSNGEIFWSRPGTLSVRCKFEELARFPFDYPVCEFEIGSWASSQALLSLSCFDDGCGDEGGAYTSGNTYSEYKLHEFDGSPHVYTYPWPPTSTAGYELTRLEDQERHSDPDSDFAYSAYPVVQYKVKVKRAYAPYVWGLIVPMLFLAAMSCAIFWTECPCGERLGFTVTTVLSCVAFIFTIQDKLPWCHERLFISDIIGLCTFITCINMLENVVVVSCFYSTNPDILKEGHFLSASSRVAIIFKFIVHRDMYADCSPLPHETHDEVSAYGKADQEGKSSGRQSMFASAVRRNIDTISPPDIRTDGDGPDAKEVHSPVEMHVHPQVPMPAQIFDDAGTSLGASLQVDAPAVAADGDSRPPTVGGDSRPPTARSHMWDGLFEAIDSAADKKVRRGLDDFRSEESALANERWTVVSNALDDICKRTIIPCFVITIVLLHIEYFV